jgi:hypothetical protein
VVKGDTPNKILRFQDVKFEEVGEGAWDRMQAAALEALKVSLLAPFELNTELRISQYEKTATDRATDAMKVLKDRRIAGDALTLTEANVTTVKLTGVSVWPNALQVDTVAEGTIEIEVRPIAIGR